MASEATITAPDEAVTATRERGTHAPVAVDVPAREAATVAVPSPDVQSINVEPNVVTIETNEDEGE
jgi:hypothetical protein